MRAHVVEVAKSRSCATNEAALLFTQDREHTLHNGWIKKYIVVQKMDIGGTTLFEQELALFRQTKTWQMAVKRDVLSMPAQCLNQRLNLDTLQVAVFLGSLIGNNDVEIAKGLTEQAGQDNGQASFTATGWNKYIDERQRITSSISCCKKHQNSFVGPSTTVGNEAAIVVGSPLTWGTDLSRPWAVNSAS